jgi:hypothetical protein
MRIENYVNITRYTSKKVHILMTIMVLCPQRVFLKGRAGKIPVLEKLSGQKPLI